jgi:hypothetical protein
MSKKEVLEGVAANCTKKRRKNQFGCERAARKKPNRTKGDVVPLTF